MTLPQPIGSRIRIPTSHPDRRRWVERSGFVPESGDTQYLTMRRDLGDMTLKVEEEPRWPVGAGHLVEIL